MMETNKVNINQLDDIRGGDIEYHPVKNDDRWKVSVIKECIDLKFGRLDVDGFSADELKEIWRRMRSVAQPRSILQDFQKAC